MSGCQVRRERQAAANGRLSTAIQAGSLAGDDASARSLSLKEHMDHMDLVTDTIRANNGESFAVRNGRQMRKKSSTSKRHMEI